MNWNKNKKISMECFFPKDLILLAGKETTSKGERAH
jgi:hypothetical protein